MGTRTTKQDSVSSEVVPVGKGRVVDHLVGKAVPYLPPWLAAGIVPPVAGASLHAMWGDQALSAGLVSAGLATAGLALSTVTWKVSGGSNEFRKFRRVQATASVAAGMGWLTCSVAAGPFVHPMLDLWLLGGGALAASWNLRRIMHHAQDQSEENNTADSGMDKLRAAIGWEKTQVKDAKTSGKGTVTAEVAVEASGTVADVQASTAKVAAALEVPPSGVTVTPDPENAARATVAIRVADLLKDGVGFQVPHQLGLLPTEPIPVGLYADGETWSINPFAETILQHLLVMGVSGAGKSEFMRAVLGHLMTRRQTSVVLVDVAKGRQSVGHLKEGLDWLIQTPAEAKRMLKAMPAAIAARGDRLADEGLDQWAPASSLNAVVVWLEEAADLADFDQLEKLARAARSVGIWLVVSLQRATWTNLSTDVRANLQATACFGVNAAEDATFCLPDEVTGAGAVPAWGNYRPGYAYATGMGIRPDRWTTEVRSSLTDRDALAALVADAAPHRDPLDDVTATALGQVYAQREHRGTNKATPGTASAAAPAASAARPAASDVPEAALDDLREEFEMNQDVDDEIREAADEVLGLIGPEPEPGAVYANLTIDDEIPELEGGGGLVFETPERPSTEQAREILYAELDGWVHQGRLDFEPADLIPATTAAGRKRPWLQGELKRLVEQGLLRKDGHGEYSIVHSPLTPA